MGTNDLFGLLLVIVGVFLVGYGIRASQTVTNQIVGGITGRYTSRTMWYLIGGGLLILGGAALMFLGSDAQPAMQPY